MINIEIDGRAVKVERGTTIIVAADKLGIEIPRFCYHKKLTIAANCRMCLVQVEKFSKPFPACATPVTEGMKIFTRSEFAIQAQKSVLEFLLINHPLDCPICDEGGECDLQDIAVAYGPSASRYTEEKRVVLNKNIGPLISTDMTRCIQCTRCVRFLKEVGGMMELGMVGRGEHAEITAYVDKSVDSELSGNIIDLCPVGALTSKPFRYSARSWELIRRPSIAPHDGMGSHIEVQVKAGRVMRVLPREEESINECWLSDRDRFSYEGLNSEDRLTVPMIKHHGQWHETDWKTALEFAASHLKQIADNNTRDIGVLVSPTSTLEEAYLAKKLAQGLGTGNLDHRLRQSDFRLDDKYLDGKHKSVPWMGCSISDLQEMDRMLVIGSNLRNEHPLLSQRLRRAVAKGAQLSLVNPLDDDPLMAVANKIICTPDDMVSALAQILKAMSGLPHISSPLPKSFDGLLKGVKAQPGNQAIAESLVGLGKDFTLLKPRVAVLLGNLAQHHPRYAEIFSLAEAIAALCGGKFGVLSAAANSVGADLAAVLPSGDGLNAKAMLESPRKAYLLVNIEPELDCHNTAQARLAMEQAECVVALTAYKSAALENAHVLLPIAPFTETSGTFISMEGRVQSFSAAAKPLGECRPAWKVLRVLGNTLGLSGFDFDSSEQVKDEVFDGKEPAKVVSNRLNNQLGVPGDINLKIKTAALQRVGEVPQFQSDSLVRRSPPLQKTKYIAKTVAGMHSEQLAKLGLKDGEQVLVKQGAGSATLTAKVDNRVPLGCVRVATANSLSSALGDLMGEIEVVRA